MPMLPRVASLEPFDLPDFASLLRQDGHAPSEFVKNHRQHLDGERTILVVRVDESVAGFVSLLSRSSPALAQGEGVKEIGGLYVSIVHRGRGLGRALLNAAEALAAARGARQTALTLPVRGDPAALHLVTSLGYEWTGCDDAWSTPWSSIKVFTKSLVPLPFPTAHSLAA